MAAPRSPLSRLPPEAHSDRNAAQARGETASAQLLFAQRWHEPGVVLTGV
jgi:hypothetical protein